MEGAAAPGVKSCERAGFYHSAFSRDGIFIFFRVNYQFGT
jgi:hypothetical protein